MLQFPDSSYLAKRIPKDIFYKQVDMSADVKRVFVDGIDSILWRNKLSHDTLNIASGRRVIEIEVFEIALKQKAFDNKVIELIEKAIPKHIVFILTYGDEAMLLVNYKEENEAKRGKFKVIETYHSEWLPLCDVSLNVEGLNMDQVYDSFVRQVASGKLSMNVEEDIQESVMKAKELEKLNKQIASLEAKKRKEKQFNKQLTISSRIKELKKKLEEITI